MRLEHFLVRNLKLYGILGLRTYGVFCMSLTKVVKATESSDKDAVYSLIGRHLLTEAGHWNSPGLWLVMT